LSFRISSRRTGLQARSSAVRHVLGYAGACPSIADGKWRGTALRARVLLARRYSSFRAFSRRTGLQARSSPVRHAGTGLETRSTFSPTGRSAAITRCRPTKSLPLRRSGLAAVCGLLPESPRRPDPHQNSRGPVISTLKFYRTTRP
jgi:hypothetical protein